MVQTAALTPSAEFLLFVKDNTPLANKLRDKWLYELARTKSWLTYTSYYQPTTDLNLICYYQIAKYNLGQQQEALHAAEAIWLNGESQPQSCNTLFDFLVRDPSFKANLITQRFAMALDKRNLSLARYLLKQYKNPQLEAVAALDATVARPASILFLSPNPINAYIYLYGLKRLVNTNIDQAIKVWEHPKTKYMLNTAQQQAFLAHLTLYKAMRNHEDAYTWFQKIKPAYYTDILVEWQIRFTLKNEDWVHTEQIITHFKNKDLPCWQYWLARSLEQQGKIAEARAIYEPLAKNRHYYGFLASIRLQQKPNFANEWPTYNLTTLKPYQPIINEIRSLYLNKQALQASRLLNDFISELPKEDASALVLWVADELKWHAKSVFLSNNELLNNQLVLRFPLAYKNIVEHHAQNYHVDPELVYAIIRQESSFREDVVSSAGAKGLMQLMPSTASVVAKMNKIAYHDQKQLFLSQKNINIGIAYLQQLGKRFSNHPVLIAAAYNAGPRQVVYWMKNHPPKEIDIWIETLPWQETRNYLKNVMAFYVVYQYRLNHKPNLNHILTPWLQG